MKLISHSFLWFMHFFIDSVSKIFYAWGFESIFRDVHLQSESFIFTLLQIRKIFKSWCSTKSTTIVWMFFKVLSYRTCCIFHKRKDMSWSVTSSACYSALISSLLSQQKLHYSFIVKGFGRKGTRNFCGRDFKATDSILHINIIE